ncbi:MAG: FHA domain-containing protein, partial [Calditrichia bacterium]|nr:FHA domain-containing protein [Calditrichia bacterium]
ELLQKYLRHFPDDTEVKAFHHRLLDFTSNDPKQAQTAFVEAKKLKLRLQQYPENPQKALLSGDEKNDLKALLPYHQELNKTYNQLLALEEDNRILQVLGEDLKEVKKLVKEGYLNKAQSLIKEMQHEHENQVGVESEIKKWQEEITLNIEEGKKTFNEVERIFRSGFVTEGADKLNDMLKSFQDHKKAVALKKEIDAVKDKSLLQIKIGDKLINLNIYFKPEITIGRLDDDVKPDIAFDDRRISRKHAVIRWVEGRMEIEDFDSTGGTFINGEKISVSELKDRQTLNFAKFMEFNVLAGQQGEKTSGVLLSGKNGNYLILRSQFSFGLKGNKISTSQPQMEIQYKNKIPVLTWENGYCVLAPGKTAQTPAGKIEVPGA